MNMVSQRGLPLAQIEFALVMLVVFLAPINFLRLQPIYVTASDAVAVAAFIVMLLGRRMQLRFLGSATSLWMMSFVLLQGGLIIGSVVNGNPLDGLLGFAQYTFSLVLMPILICNRSRAEILTLMKVFTVSIVLIMIHGVYVMQVTPDDLRFVSRSGRLTSLIERENAAGTMIALAISFGMFLYVLGRMRLSTLVICTAPLVYGLFLTGSNTGFALTLIGIAGTAFISGSYRFLAGVLIVGAASLFTIIGWGEHFLPDIFMRRVFGALQTGELSEAGTFTDRMFLIHEAMEVARETLLIGLGTDQYRVISAHGAPVHNTYLLVLTEGSLMSLFGLIGLYLTGVYLSWQAARQSDSWNIGGMTLIVMLLFALAMNGFAHFYARFWAVPFLLALALSLASAPAGSSARRPITGTGQKVSAG